MMSVLALRQQQPRIKLTPALSQWEILTGANTGQGALDLANNFDELADSMPSGRGYISLEHDLYQQEVDVAVGYILPAALAQTSPKLSVKSVVDCIGLPITQAC